MGLNTDWPHAVDVLFVDDTQTNSRMQRQGKATGVTATALRCRINDVGVKAVETGNREAVGHLYKVHFPADPGLTAAHRLRWTRPDSAVVTMRVIGTRRPLYRGLPWVVVCVQVETAEPKLTTPTPVP